MLCFPEDPARADVKRMIVVSSGIVTPKSSAGEFSAATGAIVRSRRSTSESGSDGAVVDLPPTDPQPMIGNDSRRAIAPHPNR
jgi:hypothetical protein